ncbi:hypothetical protein [Paenibacillus larvae]|uniref:Putative DNA relaxase NicK n=1 Tax=Paenibacillus larvae subsp. larvae TaxID=147375 RepID=A0A6C0QX69_9BACL|nr:hypothetical protein [Paenibacillus larvae]QHZ53375.1 putative DNA relaxase NicK [Paenibacillus larvae subsp. larvae]
MNEIKRAEQVKNTENLAVYIDRCVLAVKKETLGIISEVLRIPYDSKRPREGFYSVGCPSVRFIESKHKYGIHMIGEGCRDFERYLRSQGFEWNTFFKRMLEYEVEIRNIDLTIDDQKKIYNISDLIERAKKEIFTKQVYYDGSIGDRSILLGSTRSELVLMLYEGWNMNRYELRFRQKQAMEFIKKLVKENDLLSIAKEFLHDVFPK